MILQNCRAKLPDFSKNSGIPDRPNAQKIKKSNKPKSLLKSKVKMQKIKIQNSNL
jgi:hypothetical protein